MDLILPRTDNAERKGSNFMLLCRTCQLQKNYPVLHVPLDIVKNGKLVFLNS